MAYGASPPQRPSGSIRGGGRLCEATLDYAAGDDGAVVRHRRDDMPRYPSR